MKTEFVVRESSAHQPSSRKWMHRRTRVAVMEVEPGTFPAMISARARGVIRIVRVWEDLYTGPSQHCQYARAMSAAREMAERLSAGQS
jgi:hypothetical protein